MTLALCIGAFIIALPVLFLAVVCWAIAVRDLSLDLPGALE